jgi:hypothetical protein
MIRCAGPGAIRILLHWHFRWLCTVQDFANTGSCKGCNATVRLLSSNVRDVIVSFLADANRSSLGTAEHSRFPQSMDGTSTQLRAD